METEYPVAQPRIDSRAANIAVSIHVSYWGSSRFKSRQWDRSHWDFRGFLQPLQQNTGVVPEKKVTTA